MDGPGKTKYPADYKKQCPVRPPPEPPTRIHVNANHPKPAVNHTTSLREQPRKLSGLYQRELPRHPPPQTPLANVNMRQTSNQWESELRPLPSSHSLPPGSLGKSPKEHLYKPVEPVYLEILPSENHNTFQEQESSRAQRIIHDQIDFNANMNTQELIQWMAKLSKTAKLTPTLYGLSAEEQMRSLHERTMNTMQALRLLSILMIQRSQQLREYIVAFQSLAELLERDKKKVKSMGIAGGTTGAVGGVTAVVGIVLAPVTMCVSLAATAVGVGMVGVAGGMGVRALKPNNNIVDRKMIKTLVTDYMTNFADIERCLKYILSEIKELQGQDLNRLRHAGALPETLTAARKLQSVTNNINNGRNDVRRSGTSSVMLLHTFATEIDQYFKEKQGKEMLKRSNKSRLSVRIQQLAQNLKEEFDYVDFVWKCSVT
ncbi:uncharacterized protein LOC133515140 isoform X2 [Syngnathoides biaculeatus]|uniref:uncharacterized protein LOC133515140 isoform X2 n=1 Tax=Syngnathoides biaculeatus TaxID=300417 RepID=UPI002ADE2622|nr:uncharacterized protein LOC133515140 isoform X2 [Syngnathoides biaculeatus]